MSSQNYRNGVQEWDEKLAQCPYYPSHQIRPTRFGHHLLQCRSFLVSKLLTFRSALLFMWQVRKCKALEAYFFLFSALCLPIFFFHTLLSRLFLRSKSVQKCSTAQSFTFPKFTSFKLGTLTRFWLWTFQTVYVKIFWFSTLISY